MMENAEERQVRFLFIVHKNEEKAEQNSVLFHRLTLKERGLRPNGYFPLMRQPLFPNMERAAGICRFSDREIEAFRVIACLKKTGMESKDIRQFMV